jgi:hypothetical protein
VSAASFKVSTARASLVLITAILPVTLFGTLKTSEARSAPMAFDLPKDRPAVIDALRDGAPIAIRASDSTEVAARSAIDASPETAWSGHGESKAWVWAASFARPAHLGVIRVRWGKTPTIGVPTGFQWEILAPGPDDQMCDGTPPSAVGGWTPLSDTNQEPSAGLVSPAQPTRRSWFVDASACGLRLVITATNAGPPVLRDIRAIESAQDVLRDGVASDDGASPGSTGADAIDGTYARRWVGTPGQGHWTLRVDLPEPASVDRVRLVLGFNATSAPRSPSGRSYGIAWGPIHYALETSEDGIRFERVASEPVRADGTILPLRRRLVSIDEPRPIRALRLAMIGATDGEGRPAPEAFPVVREIAAYRSDDARPILAAPWILSVNANPSGQSRLAPGGELMDDARHAKFLQERFASLLPTLRADDPFARIRGGWPEVFGAAATDHDGEALESIEGDDPQLDATLLAKSIPPPIAVLSGSNDWDYAPETGPDPAAPQRWHWDPLRVARLGGMGQLARAVRARLSPFLGFCGGAQLLSLLEAEAPSHELSVDDEDLIDEVLSRTTGKPIRGFAPPAECERSWPGDPRPARATVVFDPTDPLFTDLAGATRRSTTQELPLSHADAVRPDAFLPDGPLRHFEVVATSTFCGAEGSTARARDALATSAKSESWCRTVPQAFRSRDRAWPVIGAQFHAEQRDFTAPASGDPPESVADPRLFLAAAYELIVDASLRLAP